MLQSMLHHHLWFHGNPGYGLPTSRYHIRANSFYFAKNKRLYICMCLPPSSLLHTYNQSYLLEHPQININSSDEEVFLFYIYIHTRLEQAIHGCCDNGDGIKTSPEVDNDPIGSIRDLMDVERTEVRGPSTRDGVVVGGLRLRGIGASAVEQLADIMSMAESLELIAERCVRATVGCSTYLRIIPE